MSGTKLEFFAKNQSKNAPKLLPNPFVSKYTVFCVFGMNFRREITSMKFGYARVSKNDQSLDAQVQKLTVAGCDEITPKRRYRLCCSTRSLRSSHAETHTAHQ